MVICGFLWMFRGASVCHVDAKGRFAMPTKYRDFFSLGDLKTCVITIDTEDDCLLLYPVKVWEEIEQKLQSLSGLNKKVRRIQRLLIGHAHETDLDSNGRLLLPQLLREHAHVKKKLVMVGQGNKFELWSESDWQKMRTIWLDRDHDDDQDPLPDALMDIMV